MPAMPAPSSDERSGRTLSSAQQPVAAARVPQCSDVRSLLLPVPRFAPARFSEGLSYRNGGTAFHSGAGGRHSSRSSRARLRHRRATDCRVRGDGITCQRSPAATHRLLLLSLAHPGSALRARSMKVRSAGVVVSARAASNALLASSLRETLLSSSARTAWNR